MAKKKAAKKKAKTKRKRVTKTMKFKKVKIAVAVNQKGEWAAEGWDADSARELADIKSGAVERVDGYRSDVTYHVVWVEAEVPIPPADETVKVGRMMWVEAPL